MRTLRLLVVAIALAAPAEGFAGSKQEDALLGLKTVQIDASVPPSAGVDPSVFVTAIELRLRRAGVSITRDRSIGAPTLLFWLVPYALQDQTIEGSVFAAGLELREDVTIRRSRIIVTGTTWRSRTWIGVRPRLDLSLKEIAEAVADQYAADYLAENTR